MSGVLARTPEPELMDEAAQARAYAEADFEEPHQAYVDRVRARFPLTGELRGIDLGCGPGDIPLRFARTYPGLSLLGVDGSAAMIALAEQARTASEFDLSRIEYRACRIDALPEEVIGAGFDFIVSNSLLHHLHDPTVLWRTIRRVAKPGAAIFVGDLFRPASAAEVDRFVEVYAADEPEVLRRDFRASLHAAFTPDEVRGQLAAAGLALVVETISDRHLQVHGYAPQSA